MKVVAVLGSPRAKSNSTGIANVILEELRNSGAEVQSFVLSKLTFKGCQACETCKTKLSHCVLKDDLTAVLEAVKAADVVVMTTPNYFGEVSGQFKSFFDRTYSFLNPDFSSRLDTGKKSVFIFSQGRPDLDRFADVFPRYEAWLGCYGFSQNHLIRMNGPRDSGSFTQRADLIEQAKKVAAELIAQ